MNVTEPRPGRTLVLCFDGTSNEFDGDNTNVVKLLALLRKDQPHKQLVFYQPGIGTFAKPGILTPLMLWIAQMVDMAIAWYLDEHVLGGYMFLMQNYRAGDKIVMFGFSRGAYVVRALAGMLHKVGLLPPGNLHHAPFAYKLYRRNDKLGFERSAAFKRCFTPAQPVEIEFLGLWDTVASVGMITPRRLPFTSSNSTVRIFRHALSLDERRARFRPTLWAYPHNHPSADVPKRKLTLKQSLTELGKKAMRRSTGVTAPRALETVPTSPPAPSLHVIPETESPVDTMGSVRTPPSSATVGRSPPRPKHARLPGTTSTAEHPVDLPNAPLPEAGSSGSSPEHAESCIVPDAATEKPAPADSGSAGVQKSGSLRRLIGNVKLALPRRKTTGSVNPSRSNTAEQQHALEDQYDMYDASHRPRESEDSGSLPITDADRWRAHAGSPGSPMLASTVKTDVREVWFAGDHCDVGGGNALDADLHPLSDIPLHWMIREVVRAQVDVQWDHAAFARANMPLPAFGLALSPGGSYGQLHHRGGHHRSESEPRYSHWNRQGVPDSGMGLGLSVDGHQAGGDVTPNLSRAVSREDNYHPQPQLTFSRSDTPIPDRDRDRASVRPQQQQHPQSDSALTVRPDQHGRATSFQFPRAPSSSTLQLNAYGPAAIADSNDQLQIKAPMSILWWVLEIFPTVYWYQTARGHWKKTKRPNLGQPRRLPHGAKLHESVKCRMEQMPGYLPRVWDTRKDEEVEFVF